MATATAPTNISPTSYSPAVAPEFNKPKKSIRLTLWPLVAATFFMVSGGTYGTEDIVHGAGYGKGILILLLTPLLWSLPTAFMIGELSSALPFEGGYYAWVRRAMGNEADLGLLGFRWHQPVDVCRKVGIVGTVVAMHVTKLLFGQKVTRPPFCPFVSKRIREMVLLQAVGKREVFI